MTNNNLYVPPPPGEPIDPYYDAGPITSMSVCEQAEAVKFFARRQLRWDLFNRTQSPGDRDE